MSNELDETIRDNAAGPKGASGDSGSVEQHPLGEQIAADKYLESKKASRAKGLGIKIAKISPGGTVWCGPSAGSGHARSAGTGRPGGFCRR